MISESINKQIEASLTNMPGGTVTFPTDFRAMGTDTAIRQALCRASKKNLVKRLAHGIYYIPKHDPVLGELTPGPQEVAKMVASKEKVSIRPTGVSALNLLGLSTQVPTKLVYMTDGNPRIIKVGKAEVKFVSASHKQLALRGKITSLLIPALQELELEKLTDELTNRIQELLKKEDKEDLEHDLQLAPARISNYIFKLISKTQSI